MKLNNLTLCLVTAVAITSGAAEARGVIDGAAIDRITTSGSSAYLINTGVDSRPINGETIPSCASNIRSMSISTDDRANLALLLTAYASGAEVRLVGSDECNEVNSVESIGFIQVR